MKFINVPVSLLDERVLRSPMVLAVWLYLHLHSCGYGKTIVSSRGGKSGVEKGKKKEFEQGTMLLERSKICKALEISDSCVRNAIRRLDNCKLITVFKDEEIGRNMLRVNSVNPSRETFGSYLQVELPTTERSLYLNPKHLLFYLFLMLYAEEYQSITCIGTGLKRGQGIITQESMSMRTGLSLTEVQTLLKVFQNDMKVMTYERHGNEGLLYTMERYPSEVVLQSGVTTKKESVSSKGSMTESNVIPLSSQSIASGVGANASVAATGQADNAKTAKEASVTANENVIPDYVEDRNITPAMWFYFTKRKPKVITADFVNPIIRDLSDMLTHKLPYFNVEVNMGKAMSQYLDEHGGEYPDVKKIFAFIKDYQKKLDVENERKREEAQKKTLFIQETGKVSNLYMRAYISMTYFKSLIESRNVELIKENMFEELWAILWNARITRNRPNAEKYEDGSTYKLPKHWSKKNRGYASMVLDLLKPFTSIEAFMEKFIPGLNYTVKDCYKGIFMSFENYCVHAKKAGKLSDIKVGIAMAS